MKTLIKLTNHVLNSNSFDLNEKPKTLLEFLHKPSLESAIKAKDDINEKFYSDKAVVELDLVKCELPISDYDEEIDCGVCISCKNNQSKRSEFAAYCPNWEAIQSAKSEKEQIKHLFSFMAELIEKWHFYKHVGGHISVTDYSFYELVNNSMKKEFKEFEDYLLSLDGETKEFRVSL